MATPHATGRHSDERGAVLIQVAVAMLALLALSSFVFDYGVMWVSRGQAQNAADAGALSGAISLAFDSGTDQDGARAKAIAVARRNRVWAAEPDITDADVTFPPCPPGAPGLPDTCVKVDAFRNQRPGGSPLPTFFGRLVNITRARRPRDRHRADHHRRYHRLPEAVGRHRSLGRVRHGHQRGGGRVPRNGSGFSPDVDV